MNIKNLNLIVPDVILENILKSRKLTNNVYLMKNLSLYKYIFEYL